MFARRSSTARRDAASSPIADPDRLTVADLVLLAVVAGHLDLAPAPQPSQTTADQNRRS